MGKHEVGTPKYIANKIKAKGLQKLRWYCQMCQKQCRDENGFKCHTMSESHQRQLLLFADNPHKYLDQFSQEFAKDFLHLLKRQFGTKRVAANRVYQDYIADRNHTHMNATRWLTLTGFVKWLGRTGKCIVDETEKGWFITWIDRDPETIAAEEKKEKKQKLDKDDNERMADFIKKQIKQDQAKGNGTSTEEQELQPLQRAENDEPLVLDLNLKFKKPLPLLKPTISKNIKTKETVKIKEEPLDEESLALPSTSKRKATDTESEVSFKMTKKSTKSDEESEEVKGWLRVGLCVKIITKSLGDKYFKAKGEVLEIMDKGNFVGKIKLKSPDEVEGSVLKIDQEHLETIIPGIGKEVMVLSGKYEDQMAIVEKVRIDDFCVDVELVKRKKLLKKVPYEHVCKYICTKGK